MHRIGVAAMALVVLVACNRGQESTGEPATSASARLVRRAFDGAPPVIPHAPLGADCTVCHTETGRVVPTLGRAPANPHRGTPAEAGTANCRQCHLFQQVQEQFAESEFVGLRHPERGERLFPGAPPVMPHPLWMRENCSACHDGPAARAELHCDHAERIHCGQCHVVVESHDPPLGYSEASRNLPIDSGLPNK